MYPGNRVVFNVPQDPDGVAVIYRSRNPINNFADGGVSISDLTRTIVGLVPQSPENQLGHMQRLEAICTASGVRGGSWFLQTSTNTAEVRYTLQQPALPVPGTRYVWDFPTPLISDDGGDSFTIQQSTTGMGTWFFISNGWYGEDTTL